MEIVTKVCFDCKETKPVSEFPKAKQNKDGYLGRCRICREEWNRQHYLKNKSSYLDKARAYYRVEENRRRRIETTTAWVKRFPEKRRAFILKKYGITVAEYQAMFDSQNGQCAICGKTSKVALNVDHCHKTGAVRKLLCGTCNNGLGCFKDNPELTALATEYLKSQSLSRGQ